VSGKQKDGTQQVDRLRSKTRDGAKENFEGDCNVLAGGNDGKSILAGGGVDCIGPGFAMIISWKNIVSFLLTLKSGQSLVPKGVRILRDFYGAGIRSSSADICPKNPKSAITT
jgi:hypothetical protein